jgi:NADPH:quinone reductase-like Zn-dependent oxidoreductase
MAVQQWITPLKGLDSLSRTESPMPTPGPSEVLVEIRAVSLNYRDVEGMSAKKIPCKYPASSMLISSK